MTIRRRDFLTGGAALSLAAVAPAGAFAQGVTRGATESATQGTIPAAAFLPKPDGWRRFELTTRVELARPVGTTQAWIPLPAIDQANWLRPMGNLWSANTMDITQVHDATSGAEMVHVAWAAGTARPVVEVTSRFAARDRSADLTKPGTPHPLSAQERARYTAATAVVPTDGIVKATADRITAGAGGDVAKARRLYDWIVENTYRKASTRGCGSGDIAALLASGDLGGKCADLNTLFVALARASGIPARDLYGIRVAPSKFGYRSLGANSETVTGAQHCRAEVWLEAYGWVAMDPADVRKVMLEEPPTNLTLGDPKVAAARRALFGAWETNWLAYNDARDVALPGAHGPKLAFLMYPQAETAAGRLDCLDANAMKYTITAKELTA